jgi:hypothetical protein
MTTQPWWFELLTATSDTDSSDDEWIPPSPRNTLVRQRAVADTQESEIESESETESEASIDIEHTDDETESDPEPTTSDDEFIVLDETP